MHVSGQMLVRSLHLPIAAAVFVGMNTHAHKHMGAVGLVILFE